MAGGYSLLPSLTLKKYIYFSLTNLLNMVIGGLLALKWSARKQDRMLMKGFTPYVAIDITIRGGAMYNFLKFWSVHEIHEFLKGYISIFVKQLFFDF